MLIRGDRLNAAQRRQVLDAYIYRWTVENHKKRYKCPHCNLDKIEFGRVECRQHHPTIALVTDDEWLKQYAFHFVKDGSRLMANRHHAEPIGIAEAMERDRLATGVPG